MEGILAMATKILVAVDFSPMTASVVAWATSVAYSRRASLILLHVQEPLAELSAGLFPAPLEENAVQRHALESLKPDNAAVNYEYRFLLGPAPEGILETATKENVDLIVMGSHGRGWLGRLLMGSVVECVMRRASCPVLIVSPPCKCPAADESVETPAGLTPSLAV
jgi:nucleotide-binding universal stress UspA family protein